MSKRSYHFLHDILKLRNKYRAADNSLPKELRCEKAKKKKASTGKMKTFSIFYESGVSCRSFRLRTRTRGTQWPENATRQEKRGKSGWKSGKADGT